MEGTMTDDDCQTAQKRLRATRQLLGTIESALEPVLDSLPGMSDLALVDRYTGNLRRFVLTLLEGDAEPTDDQRAAYQRLFGQQLPDSETDRIALYPDARETRQTLVDFIGFLGDLEARIGGSATSSGVLDGTTVDLVETVGLVGDCFVALADPGVEAARRLDSIRKECRKILLSRDLIDG
jgi:hypothetical protein